MSKVSVSDFIIAVSDLIEAQSSELQKSWSEFFDKERSKNVKLFFKIGLIAVFSFLILLGFITFLYATYLLLSKFIPQYLAVYIISGLFFIITLFLGMKIKNDS